MQEFRVLQHIYRANAALSTTEGASILIPPGDDMAMIDSGHPRLLAAVDQVIDGVHVDTTRHDLALVGRKAVARCLSDVAAMAACPVAALATGALPSAFTEAQSIELFDAMRDAAERYCCPLIGGDVAAFKDPSARLLLTVTVLARPWHDLVIRRDGAQVGDGVFVTGVLGGSWRDGGDHHLAFEPRIELARQLLATLGPDLHSMIDVSDGLARDAGHLAASSSVDVELDAAAIPVRDGASRLQALSDGEDYELCFTARGDEVPESIDGVAITRIGSVRESRGDGGRLQVRDGDTLLDAEGLGWEHGTTT